MKKHFYIGSAILFFSMLILCQALAKDKNNKDNFDVILEPFSLNYNELDLNNLKVSLEKQLMPKASEAEKVEISEFIYLIDKALDQKKAFFENSSQFAKLIKGNAGMAIISYKYIDPDDIDTQLRIPSSLLAATHVLEMLENSNAERNSNVAYSQDIEMLKRKSVELAKKTLRRFPDAGRAYGQLAFVLYRTGGNKKEISRLYKRCIDLDQAASFCRDGYHAIQHKND